MNRISRRALLALAAIAGVCAPALAEEWAPTRTVRIVVPIVGGTNDVVGRLVAPELQKALGETVIVETRGAPAATSAPTRWPGRPRTATRCWSASTVWLACDEASFITGTTLMVDGGLPIM